MYADTEARGGVLEPEGVVEVRFRAKDLVKAMHRCDNVCQQIMNQMQTCFREEEKKRLEQQLNEREQLLMPIYHQAALHFADLHDTPVRMQEKGCIADIIPWARSRNTIYWRLRRLLYEDRVKNSIQRVLVNKSNNISNLVFPILTMHVFR